MVASSKDNEQPESFEQTGAPDLSGAMYCEHQRTADSCEECAYTLAKATGRPVPPVRYTGDDTGPLTAAEVNMATGRGKSPN